jgi:DnaJ-class molecular chaperone
MSKDACCPRCTGGGMIVSAETCPECAGHPYSNCDGVTMVCEHCHGTGKKNVPCPECADHKH